MPRFMNEASALRHGRGCHDALRCVEELLAAGYVYVVDADLKAYFDTIPKDRLLEIVRQKISDRRVLGLIEQFLNQGIMEDLYVWTPEAGVPQGAVLSPVLSNTYLNPLDHQMAANGFQMVRYADDFVILCRTQEEAEAALAAVRAWVDAHGLETAPGQDAHCGRAGQEFCVSWLCVSGKVSLSASEEPSQVRRSHPGTHPTEIGRVAGVHAPEDQSSNAGLVPLLPSLPLEHLLQLRRHDSPTFAADASETQSTESQTRVAKPSLAKRLLHGAWVHQPE